MDASLIVAAIAAAAAVAAAFWARASAAAAKRSADAAERTASAEERSADAAHAQLDFERERVDVERHDREGLHAPVWRSPSRERGADFVVGDGGALTGLLENAGGTTAAVESALVTFLDRTASATPCPPVPPGETARLDFPDARREDLGHVDTMEMALVYTAVHGRYRARASFTLRRSAPDAAGRLTWRAEAGGVVRA